MSKDGKTIERIYIIPYLEIIKRPTISVYKNPSRGVQWYEKYRVTDKDEVKKVNEIYGKILEKRKKK